MGPGHSLLAALGSEFRDDGRELVTAVVPSVAGLDRSPACRAAPVTSAEARTNSQAKS